jgi:serine/threonine-protein kinase
VGDFEILHEIAQGGMGIVYKARCVHTRRVVALKMIRPGIFLDDDALRRFKREVRATAAAEHDDYIVPLRHTGEHEGQPYYTMKLFSYSLAGRAHAFRTPARAAELIERVARAVQHAHDCGFLHLDLKPANVLIQDDDTPRIADFGLARLADSQAQAASEPLAPGIAPVPRLPGSSSARSLLGWGGTPPYSAPEQLSRKGTPTTACDVYGVGAILHELLTERSPDTAFAAEQMPEPRWPRADRVLGRDLLAIARVCLNPDAGQRYRSAADLADDVGRAIRREPTLARPLSSRERLLRAVWRRRLVSVAIASLAVAMSYLLVTGVRIVTRWSEEQTQSVLLANGLAAKFAAGWTLNQLHETMARVERIAADPEIVALASGREHPNALLLRGYQQQGFGLVAVYDQHGIIKALWPEGPARILGRDYAWRDYFRGACRAGAKEVPGAYVARAFQSENDGDYNLSISAPILAHGRCVGLVLASVLTDSALGPVRLVGQDNPYQKGVLVGPQDRRRDDPAGVFPRDYLLLIHASLRPGVGVSLAGTPALAALEQRFGPPRPRGQQLELPEVEPLKTDCYRDPLEPEQCWLAAFYPVGGTGLVVGVQTRYDLVDRLIAFATSALLWLVLPAIALGGAILVPFLARLTRAAPSARSSGDRPHGGTRVDRS